MAVFAPGDSPPEPSPGADSGIDPGMWARLMSYISPIGSAQAAPAPQPTSAPGPTNDLARQQALANAQAQLNAGNASNNTRPPTLGSTPPIISAGQIPTTLPPAGPAPAGPSPSGGIGSDANFPVMGAGGFPTTYAPPGQQPAQLDGSPAVPYPPPRPAAQPAVTRGGNRPGVIPATARAQAPAAGGQSPFVALPYRPNANPGTGGGMLGGALASPRGQGGPPVSTALDLSHLFGGGQAAAPAAAAAQPRTRINVGKIPANATALVPPATSNAPLGYGPQRQGMGWPTGPDWRTFAGGRSGYQ